eukprot:Sspe_Gene.73936::Locus_45184_Transcript_1_1_Confidence_1.000_Length_1926::g.73936::m.73936
MQEALLGCGWTGSTVWGRPGARRWWWPRRQHMSCVGVMYGSWTSDCRTTLPGRRSCGSGEPPAWRRGGSWVVMGVTGSLRIHAATAGQVGILEHGEFVFVHMEVVGKVLYASSATRVYTFDVADPATPVLLGRTRVFPEAVHDGAVHGGNYYLLGTE